MKATDVAWAAGFLDGEANFHSAEHPNRKRRFTMGLQVANTDVYALRKLQHLFGGNVVGPYHYRKHHLPIYKYYVHNFARLQAIIAATEPFLITKREQALNVLINYQSFRKESKWHTSRNGSN